VNTSLTVIPSIRSVQPRRSAQGRRSTGAQLTVLPAGAAAVATGRTESDGFRRALRACPTGVTIVTSAGDETCGVTVSAFTSVSLDPPLVLVCLNAASATAAAIGRNGVFAVNVLGAAQEPLARRFASPARPRGAAAFAGVPHSSGATGAPLLDDVACWLDCRLTDIHAAGDHLVVIGEVLAFAGDAGRDPLVFHAGR
jgi:flavin reductase